MEITRYDKWNRMIRVLGVAAPDTVHVFKSMAEFFPSEVLFHTASAMDCYNGRVPLIGRDGKIVRVYFVPSKRMIDEMLEFRPDLVVTDYAAYPTWFAKVYSILRRRHAPYIVRLRGDYWREYAEYASSIAVFKRALSVVDFFSWSEGLKSADCIIPVCKWLDGVVKSRLPQKRSYVVYQGIDPDPWLELEDSSHEFKRPAIGILQDNNILPKVRGLLRFSEVAREMPDVNFYIAGGGPYTALVKRSYAKLENVHFIGRVSYPEGVRRFHASCDLYVLASGLDCSPLTLLEASLCGKPVVASRVGGVPELVREGETGWTIPNAKTDEWIQKIRLLIEDENLARRMGDNGRKFVTEKFSWKDLSRKMFEVFVRTIK